MDKWLTDLDVLEILQSTGYVPAIYNKNNVKYTRIFSSVERAIVVTYNELISLFSASERPLSECLEQINCIKNMIVIADGTDLITITFTTRFIAMEIYFNVLNKLKLKIANEEREKKSNAYVIPNYK